MTRYDELRQMEWTDGRVIRCPECGAPPKQHCYHQARIELVRELRKDCKLGSGDHYWQAVHKIGHVRRRIYRETFEVRTPWTRRLLPYVWFLLLPGGYFFLSHASPEISPAERILMLLFLWGSWKWGC